jgi:hypothetical protein
MIGFTEISIRWVPSLMIQTDFINIYRWLQLQMAILVLLVLSLVVHFTIVMMRMVYFID